MKLILKQYLSSLRERDELDVVLPDLLSQLGLNVFSRPGRGTTQRGVDVGAVGCLEAGDEKVFLFSIKAGDLTRKDWDSDSEQSLRRSLNEIIDAYIPHRLPVEHRGKKVVICICFGGDVQEQVREQLKGFEERNTSETISFEEWNGDKLSELILSNFLREDLLPENCRADLRKSLALLDEPEASYRHFERLVVALSGKDGEKDVGRITSIRQISICLWVLFAWAREAKNMESAYLAGELALLHGWHILKAYIEKSNKSAQAVQDAFLSIFSAYQQICAEFHLANTLPHVEKKHALSSAIRASNSLDINLKLFDLLGRLGISGVWAYWGARRCVDGEEVMQQKYFQDTWEYVSAIKALITNNPALLLPAKDDQAIDISISLLALATEASNHRYIESWFVEMIDRANFSYQVHGHYPSTQNSYSELLEHPQSGDSAYRETVTQGSILYPLIGLWAALVQNEGVYGKVMELKKKLLRHCNFQFWYPDENSEEHFYANKDAHGATLSHLGLERGMDVFLAQVFGECEQTTHFQELSAIKFAWWPIIIVACRHYRLPLPIQLFDGLRKKEQGETGTTTTAQE
ncbi:MAG: hypothetical protein Q7V20_16355 [Aquabacterium sp.]|uniref:hypothetical protein n=1 Tax=Aquabacterium sp. TaxID=1872578 RepID=UPI00271BF431|nr:hypothetical protein [Aquabacterium sp.]MDO9005017.1 hypothetical protein [Aquabacterium sp.]